MEKLNTPRAVKRAAEDINRIADALGVRNDAFLLVNPPNRDPNPPYRLEKAESAMRQSEKLANELEADPKAFGLDGITAALTITLLNKATDELRDATDTWESMLGSMSTGKE